MTTTTWPSWSPPLPPDASTASAGPSGYVIATDPRVTASHATGAGVPCTPNPPPPDGWIYWSSQPITPSIQAFASAIEGTPTTYPMGSFVQAIIGSQLVAARVEWHNLIGSSNTSGCFRGTNLMVPATASAEPPAPPEATNWGVVAGCALAISAVIGAFYLVLKHGGPALENPTRPRCGTDSRGVYVHRGGCHPARPLCRLQRRGKGICYCPSYHFPHRSGSGACRYGIPAPLLKRELERQAEYERGDDVPF